MKKLFALMLALVMLTGSALAADSKGTSDMITGSVDNQILGLSGFVVLPVEADLSAVIEGLVAATADADVETLFADDVREDLAEAIPASLSGEKWVLSELFMIQDVGEVPEVGTLDAEFNCPTDFSKVKAVVSVLGMPSKSISPSDVFTYEDLFGENSIFTWTVLPTKVSDKGAVVSTFTQDQLVEMQNKGGAMLAVFTIQ